MSGMSDSFRFSEADRDPWSISISRQWPRVVGYAYLLFGFAPAAALV